MGKSEGNLVEKLLYKVKNDFNAACPCSKMHVSVERSLTRHLSVWIKSEGESLIHVVCHTSLIGFTLPPPRYHFPQHIRPIRTVRHQQAPRRIVDTRKPSQPY